MPETDQCRDFRKEDWEVRDAPFREGRQMVLDNHYSRGGSNTYVYMHGLYHRRFGNLCGIAWWLPPTKVACVSVNPGDWTKVLSLTRLVIMPWVPLNGATFLLGRSIRLIRQARRFKSLVTYADESQEHTGTIYKASNWQYVGRTGPYPRWLSVDGRQVSPKATVNRTAQEMRDLGHVKQGAYFKHKFVLHL